MDEPLQLLPGFRFHPTDEEIITHYLLEKVLNQSFKAIAISEASFNECEPWDLPGKANMGEKEWFFFCKRDRKYPTGKRTNRATATGYWKATGKDKEIFEGKEELVGMKKTLVFYSGRAPRGMKTTWVMHEYRLEGKYNYNYFSTSQKEEWVVCKVYNKQDGKASTSQQESAERMNSFFLDTLLVETPDQYFDHLSFNNISNRSIDEAEMMSQFLHEEALMVGASSNPNEARSLSMNINGAAADMNSNLDEGSISIASLDKGKCLERSMEDTIGSFHSYEKKLSGSAESIETDGIWKNRFNIGPMYK